MTQTEALKLALEALAANEFSLIQVGRRGNGLHIQTTQAITAIKEALAQPEQPDLDAICQDLQEKTYNQAMRIAELEAQLAQPEQEPRNIRERWNIELDGDDLLVCFNDHEKIEGCRYERYVPATTTPPQPKEPEQEPDDLTIAYMAGLSRGKDLAPQRKPLTDDEFQAILRSLSRQQGWDGDGWDLALKEAIEKAHGIKE